MMRRFAIAMLLVTCGLTAGVVLADRLREPAAADAEHQQPAQQQPQLREPPQAQATLPVTAPGPVNPAATLVDFSQIAERVVPAVVNISTQTIVRRPVYDPFGAFFGRGDLAYRRGVENSLGSGVIVSGDGYILTNNHVVGTEASRRVTIEQLDVTVALSDKREMRAEVVGADPATDLALLKVDARSLPTIPWGDSTRLKVAEWVLAVGNPYQLSQTVTLGIVSAVNRTNLGVSTYEDFVQTDAAINPGNSGGALVNARGELVGINTVIFSESGGYQGIGFAVSSNLARRVFSDLQRYGEVRRGSIGRIRFAPLTTQLAAEYGAADTRGAFVGTMWRNTPAFESGLRPEDIVVSFNDVAVEDPGHLSRLISDARIGSTATITVIRNGRRTEIRVPVVSTSAR